MEIRVLSGDDIRRALPMPQAIEAMRAAFAALSAGGADVPQRLVLPVPGGGGAAGGTTLAMPARVGAEWLPPAGGLGAKLVSVFPGNAERGRPVTTGLMVLLDPESGEPRALLDGTALTAWRTGAASGLATDLLARPGARRAALIGAGAQAETQLLGIAAVRPLEVVRVYARREAGVRRFVERMQNDVAARLEPAASAAEAIDGAEVVCTATTSAEPVFDGARLAPGAHVNAVGSYTLGMCELDLETIRRARVVVDSREAALAEAGELAAAVAARITDPADWEELGRLAAGETAGPHKGGEVTLFKSVGSAAQDVVAAAWVVERSG